jgi:hypothetical protein
MPEATARGVSTASTAAHPPFPQLTPNQGAVTTGLKVVLIVTATETLARELEADIAALPSSEWWSAVASAYGLGPMRSSVAVVGPAIAAGGFSRAQLSEYIGGLIISGAAPNIDGHTLYLVILPAEVSLSDEPAGVRAYHQIYPDSATSLGDSMAVVAVPSPAAAKAPPTHSPASQATRSRKRPPTLGRAQATQRRTRPGKCRRCPRNQTSGGG